jgi:hypothetical protein
MTKDKFYNTRFGAGMKAISQNGYKYPIKGVDFLNGELLLKTDIGELWVSYKEVDLDEN